MTTVTVRDSKRAERARLDALGRYDILDSSAEATLDRIARLARLSLDSPVALIGFLGQDRQWFKASEGVAISETPRALAFYNATIGSDAPLIVPDLRQDARFKTNPLVTQDPNLRFYAGVPIISPDGFRIGSLCVLDVAPRDDFGEEKRALLKSLGELVTDALETRREAMQARAEARRLLDMLGSTTDLIFTKDIAGHYTYFNRDPFGEKGLKVDDIIGKTDDELFPESAAALRATDCQVMESRDPIQKEEIIWHEGKKLINFSKKTPLVSADGEVTGILGISRDVTREVETRQQLERSLSLLKAAFDATQEGVLNVDLEKNVRSFNKRYLEFFHISQALMAQQDDEALVGYVKDQYLDPEAFEKVTDAIYARPEDSSYDILELKDGRVVVRSSEPQRVGDSIIGRVWSFRDITKEKQARQALRRAKDEAEAANRAKSEFLSRMSHELRTPLNAILGFGQLLGYGDLSPDDQDAVEDILKAGKHLLGLIDDILDIARIEAGKMALSIEPVPVAEVMREALEMIRPLAEAEGVRLRFEDRPNQYLLADQQRLKQVLLNLLSNAVKYNRKGGHVHLNCETKGNLIRICVHDTGPGIAPDLLPRVFEPFDRLGAEATGVEGAGIGLSLCKHLVELMGGVIGVDSEPGRGSSFWLELKGSESPHRASELQRLAAITSVTHKDGFTTLYIEDNLSNLKLIERIFARMGQIRLLSTMQGRIGIDLALEHRPDLILLDLHLPDIPGAEVLKALRDHPETRDIPVIVVSADAMPKTVEKLSALGADAYLSKPLDIGAFHETVEHLLEQA